MLVTVIVKTLVQLGFSALLLHGVSGALQVDGKAGVAAALERINSERGQKISLSTADMASRLEQAVAS